MPSLITGMLELVLPRTCVLCGKVPLSMEEEGPLCAACAAAMTPWKGARCRSCGIPLLSEEGTCMRCRRREAEWSFDSAYPLFSYTGKARELIAAYKKRGRRRLAIPLARMVAAEISDKWPGRTLVPVPPRPGKLRAMGWDQVEEMVRALERGGFRAARPLRRLAGAEQKSLGREGRASNARASYSLRPGAASPEEPLLIDDVITTGATAEACAAALKSGGARSVAVLALAAD
jgi:competence protein ComFC